MSSKNDRRRKRKEKERAREKHHRSVKPFDPARDSLRDALQAVYRQARRDYPNLLGIFEYPHVPGEPATPIEQLIERFIGKGYEQWQLTLSDEAGGHTSGGDFGGNAAFVRREGGNYKPAIFIRLLSTVQPEHLACPNLPIFLHELGHVDDFTRGLNVVPGRSVDIVQAEFHAHRFACDRLLKGRFQNPLGFWLASIEAGLSKCGVPSVEEAARLLMELPEYHEYRTLAGATVETWIRACYSTPALP